MGDFYARIPVCKHGYLWYGAENSVYTRLDIRSSDPHRPRASVSNTLKVPHKTREPRPPLSDDSTWRFYELFSDEPALFRVFADLEPSPWPERGLTPEEVSRFHDMILGFVGKYGELEVYPLVTRLPVQVRLMRSAIELWNAIRSNNGTVLDNYLHFFKAGDYSYHNPTSAYRRVHSPPTESRLTGCPWWEYVRREFGGPKELKGWGLRDTLVTAAIQDVPKHWHSQSRQAKDLLACATDLFMLLIQSQSGAKTTVSLMRATTAQLLAIRVRVDSLLQALWIQLAVSLIEDRDYRHCKFCNKPFEVGARPQGKTIPRDKLFCSDSCRVRNSNKRKALARKMRSEGAKLPEIVRTLGTDMAQVKTWLGEQ